MLSTPASQPGQYALPSKPFHARKGHYKSRTGCEACKRRKKKCDELPHGCSGCLRSGIPCHYENTRKGVHQVVQRKTLHLPSTVVTYHGLPGFGPGEFELLRHFHAQTLRTLGSSSVQEVIAGCIAAALEFDYLKYAILSLAASHLVFLSDRPDLRVHRHLDRTLLSFRQTLSSPITSAQVDAVLTSCVLLNSIVFSACDQRPSESWLFNGTADLQWLKIQSGLRAIMFDIRHLLRQSSWAAMYTKDAESIRGRTGASFDAEPPGSESIPEDFMNVFDVKQSSNSCSTAYDSPLRSLIPLLTSDSSSNSLTQLMTVMHRFKPEFHQLIQSRDPRALLLLAYWLGLMCKVDLWWVSGRARSECFACCKYLDASGDDTIRGLLSFPAQCCGYQMGHRDA